MRAVDIIEKKRNGYELTKEEIEFMVNGFTKGTDVADYQMSAFNMAVYFRGMTDKEATYMTHAMLHSGDVLDLTKIKGVKVDKHSTGGVGDKTSLVVGPIVAALGAKFAKMSGRGLGHTGGTLDKLESIPGYNVGISEEEFFKQVNEIGIALMGQTQDLAPADKKLYALRDVTATVESIPLIASSIMSKKLAAGADVISLDVKVGSGAFMKNLDDAEKLARLMVSIGRLSGKIMSAELTNMDEPLGLAVGNSLEVIEAINTLKGKGPKDFEDLCVEVSAELLFDGGLVKSLAEGLVKSREQINNGKAFDKFVELIKAQGGDISYILNPDKFPKAKYVYEVKSEKDGYVCKMDALAIGHASMCLGGGRKQIGDIIDHAVGIVLNKKVGNKVLKGETLAYVHSNTENPLDVLKTVLDAYTIGNEVVSPKLVLKVIK
ncbi:MAG: pyrimidine-nucleoside phosphorylase [Acholeplasmatales bacterium]|nr:pyrimidine-nucleoside phosphorylase [Acholeplasmatales bacterium]